MTFPSSVQSTSYPDRESRPISDATSCGTTQLVARVQHLVHVQEHWANRRRTNLQYHPVASPLPSRGLRYPPETWAMVAGQPWQTTLPLQVRQLQQMPVPGQPKA
jgi:hypothetical protein